MQTFKQFLIEEEKVSEEAFKTPEYEVPVHNIDYLQKKIDKLNKAAVKLKCAPITLHMGEVYQKKLRGNMNDPDHPGFNRDGTEARPKYIECRKITVEGEAPKLADWSFVGKREPMEGSTSILAKSAPDKKMPPRFHDDHDIKCDHCKKKVRRNESFVVKKGRKYMEVGRSCLKDFLGHSDPNKYANFAEALWDIESVMADAANPDNEYGGRIHAVWLDPTKEAVACAVHLIKEKGFVSNQYAGMGKPSTSMLISNHFHPGMPPINISASQWHLMNNIPFTKEDEAEADKAILWMKQHPKASKEEFWTNVSKIARTEAMSPRMFGYIAAGVNTKMKEDGQAKVVVGLMKQINKDEGLGKEGEKVDVMGTVISSFAYQNDWGTKHIITVKTDSGHLVKMFTSSGDSNVKKDARVNITGKIRTVEPETYDRSIFKGMMVTTMAPRSRIEAMNDEKTADEQFHVGNKVKFRRPGKPDGIGIITAKPVYGKFEVSPVNGNKAQAIHVSHEDIICKM